MVKTLGPQAFDIELQGGPLPLLVAFLKRNERFAFQMEVLERSEKVHEDKVRFYLFNADYLDTAMERFSIKGTPTFLLFDNGREVDRLIGESDGESLNEFIESGLGS